jgi:hypothetical protein
MELMKLRISAEDKRQWTKAKVWFRLYDVSTILLEPQNTVITHTYLTIRQILQQNLDTWLPLSCWTRIKKWGHQIRGQCHPGQCHVCRKNFDINLMSISQDCISKL